jgi:hypothetical protein
VIIYEKLMDLMLEMLIYIFNLSYHINVIFWIIKLYEMEEIIEVFIEWYQWIIMVISSYGKIFNNKKYNKYKMWYI